MADRKRSEQGGSDVEEFLTDVDTPEHAGRSGGELEREIATRDEERQAKDHEGPTRVTKKDEQGEGGLGGHHGTGDDGKGS